MSEVSISWSGMAAKALSSRTRRLGLDFFIESPLMRSSFPCGNYTDGGFIVVGYCMNDHYDRQIRDSPDCPHALFRSYIRSGMVKQNGSLKTWIANSNEIR